MLSPILPKSELNSLKKGNQRKTAKHSTAEFNSTTATTTSSDLTDQIASSSTPDVFETTLLSQQAKIAPPTQASPIDSPTQAPLNKKLISTLIGKLEAAGDTLAQNPSLLHYAHYKSSLQTFLEVVLPNSYTITKKYASIPDDTTQKEYHIITSTSKELSSLLSLIKETHDNNIAITAKIDEIKGLIIDFLY